MPALETSDLNQWAVLWSAGDYPDEFGNYVRNDPEEIRVRWEHGVRDLLDPKGNSIEINAIVFTRQEIPIGSNLWEGQLADFLGTGSIGDDDNIMQVKLEKRTPDVKARNNRRAYGLVRYKDNPNL
jgi:hypothetical protein